MKKTFLLAFIGLIASLNLKAQAKTDSLAVTKVFEALLAACKAGDGAKAAQYILNTDSETSAYKVFADYKNAIDKKAVDKWIRIIKRDILDAKKYKITKYTTDKESEGVWHTLTISCTSPGKTYTIGVSFIKVDGKFGLGDID